MKKGVKRWAALAYYLAICEWTGPSTCDHIHNECIGQLTLKHCIEQGQLTENTSQGEKRELVDIGRLIQFRDSQLQRAFPENFLEV
jgi:hypothetical protein